MQFPCVSNSLSATDRKIETENLTFTEKAASEKTIWCSSDKTEREKWCMQKGPSRLLVRILRASEAAARRPNLSYTAALQRLRLLRRV